MKTSFCVGPVVYFLSLAVLVMHKCLSYFPRRLSYIETLHQVERDHMGKFESSHFTAGSWFHAESRVHLEQVC